MEKIERQDVMLSCVNDEKVLQENIKNVFAAAIQSFHLSSNEISDLEHNDVARFITALPFVAGCEDARSKALMHLSIYLTEVRENGTLSDESKSAVSTVYEDLGIFSSFDGGDDDVVQHGMAIMALIMLEGYKDRSFTDMEQGIYNPLNDESWDYYTLKASLLNDIKERSYPALDSIVLQKTGLLKNHF